VYGVVVGTRYGGLGVVGYVFLVVGTRYGGRGVV